MSQARPYRKVAAVVSSVFLVGAFIGCRTGAFHPFAKPEPPFSTGPKSAPVFGPVKDPTQANEPQAPKPATPNTPAP